MGTTVARTSRSYGWSDCPGPVRGQVLGFVSKLSEVLGSNLVGVYLPESAGWRSRIGGMNSASRDGLLTQCR